RGNAEIRQALPSDAKSQGILERLEAREKPVGLDHDARTHRRRARALKIADGTLEIDTAALTDAANADIGIDDHHRLDFYRESRQQPMQGAGLAPVDAFIDATPPGVAQALDRIVRRAVAQQPDPVPIGLVDF